MPRTVTQRIDDILDRQGTVSSGELAAALGVSRQAAHRHLRLEVDAGRLVPEGSARATRYRRPEARFEFALPALAEDRVWEEVSRQVPDLGHLVERDRQLVSYAFHEMVNNAIDHSGGRRLVVAVARSGPRLVLRIEDDGVGALEHFRALRRLASPLEALQEISKGRATTDPRRHSGEGIFFTSKAVSRFELHSGELRWIVDNVVGDSTVMPAPPRVGTAVLLGIDLPVRRSLVEVFDAYTEDHEFVRTRAIVKLFEAGTEFMSRSEARRLLHGLERFREVLVDFTGVVAVGQGFADEVFRVWPAAHPAVTVTPLAETMSPTVAFMVGRGRPASEKPRRPRPAR